MQIGNSVKRIIIKIIREYYEGKGRSYNIPYLVCFLNYIWLKIVHKQTQEKARRNLLEYIKLNSDLSYIYIQHAYKFKIWTNDNLRITALRKICLNFHIPLWMWFHLRILSFNFVFLTHFIHSNPLT